MVKKKIKSLVFLEFEDEAAFFVDNYIKKNPENFEYEIAALSFEVQHYLSAQSIKYMNTLEFFDNKSHEYAMLQSETLLNLIENLSTLDRPFSGELIIFLRFFCNYLIFITEIIYNAINARKPNMIIAPGGTFLKNKVGAKISSQERYIGFIVKEILKKNVKSQKKIDAEFFPFSPVDVDITKNAGEYNRNKGFHRKFSKINNFFVLHSLKKLRKLNTILLASSSYNFNKIPDDLKNKYLSIFLDLNKKNPMINSIKFYIKILLKKMGLFNKYLFYNFPVFHLKVNQDMVFDEVNNINNCLEQLSLNVREKSANDFNVKGINISGLISDRIKYGFTTHFNELAYYKHNFETLLNLLKPNYVLAPFSIGISSLLGHLSKKMNIPSIIITHGSHVVPNNKIEEIEQHRLSQNLISSRNFEYTLAQTPLAYKHAEYFKFSNRTIKAIPVVFAKTNFVEGEELKKSFNIPLTSKVIVYAVAQRKRSSIRFHVFEIEDEYLSTMKDLVNAVNKIDNTYLIIKLHPSTDISETDFANYLPPSTKLRVIKKENFSKVLSSCDLLVSYSSTTIEEALQNRIPVILYDKWKRYSHIDFYKYDNSSANHPGTNPGYYVTEYKYLDKVIKLALEDNSKVFKNYIFDKDKVKSLRDIILEDTLLKLKK